MFTTCLNTELKENIFGGICHLHVQSGSRLPWSRFLRNVGNFLPDYTASRPRRQCSLHSQRWEAKMLQT